MNESAHAFHRRWHPSFLHVSCGLAWSSCRFHAYKSTCPQPQNLRNDLGFAICATNCFRDRILVLLATPTDRRSFPCTDACASPPASCHTCVSFACCLDRRVVEHATRTMDARWMPRGTFECISTTNAMAMATKGCAIGKRVLAPTRRKGAVARARKDARDTVREYYDACGRGDLEGSLNCFAEDVLIEDMIYQRPFRGKREFGPYLEKVIDALPRDMEFVIDDMTGGQDGAVGLVWHVEIQGKPFPFSRGCSFYRCNQEGKIVYGRDIPEPSSKPGGIALFIIKLVAPIIRRLPPLKYNSEVPKPPVPEKLPETPRVDSKFNPVALGLWSLYAVYFYWLILSPPGQAPGDPVYAIKPESLQEIFAQSLDFFYINIFLNQVGINFVQSPVLEPVGEALFELVAAWSLMFGPLLLLDRRGSLPKLPVWTGQMFLTNVFLIPYLATRSSDGLESSKPLKNEDETLGERLATPFGWVGGAVGATSVFWALFARPEFGSITARFSAFGGIVSRDRLAYAFLVDVVLYAVFQPVLLRPVLKPECEWIGYIPFFGLAAALANPSLRHSTP